MLGSGAVYAYVRCDGFWYWVDFQDQNYAGYDQCDSKRFDRSVLPEGEPRWVAVGETHGKVAPHPDCGTPLPVGKGRGEGGEGWAVSGGAAPATHVPPLLGWGESSGTFACSSTGGSILPADIEGVNK